MNPMERIEEILASVEDLLTEVKASDDTMTVAESHLLYSKIRETEGWLQGSREHLAPY